LKWTSDGLVPAIVQDADSGDVLMMAWMNEPSIIRTLETGETHFYSRSRQALWHKGGTSGHTQRLVSMHLDCDADVLLLKVHQFAGACHEGYRSCFYRRVQPDGSLEIEGEPVFDTEAAYGPKPPARENESNATLVE
jgi:phosphoribosyl-AMP cyclohydrolase